MRNQSLKVAIVRKRMKSYELALSLGWNPSKISQIISGVYEPSEDEKLNLARALDCEVGDLFEGIKEPVHA